MCLFLNFCDEINESQIDRFDKCKKKVNKKNQHHMTVNALNRTLQKLKIFFTFKPQN